MSRIVCDLTHISRCGGQYRGRLLEPLSLTPRQASLLMEICATPGISQDTLARRVFLNKSVVARALAALEEETLVERPTCQKDKRITRLYPTEKALLLQPQLQAIWADCEHFLTDGMTEAEVATLENLLGRLQVQAANWMEAD